MNGKAFLLIFVMVGGAFFAWKAGILGGGVTADPGAIQSGSPDTAEAQAKAESLWQQYKYPAASMTIIIIILAAAWKHTPPIVKYPLMTLMFVAWVYFSGR